MAGITVHRFESTGEAYDRSQTGYDAELLIDSLFVDHEAAFEWFGDYPTLTEVRDGDILYVPSEAVVGIMVAAWPYAITFNVGKFHRPHAGWDWRAVDVNGDIRNYGASYLAAIRVRHPELLISRGLRRFFEILSGTASQLPI